MEFELNDIGLSLLALIVSGKQKNPHFTWKLFEIY